MKRFIIATIIALVGMTSSNSYAHGVQGAGQYFVNHSDLASYYNEVPANTNTHFFTVPVGRRFVLTACLAVGLSKHTVSIKENGAVKARMRIYVDAQAVAPFTADFATGIPFEAESSVSVESASSTDYVTLIGYFADLP